MGGGPHTNTQELSPLLGRCSAIISWEMKPIDRGRQRNRGREREREREIILDGEGRRVSGGTKGDFSYNYLRHTNNHKINRNKQK